MLQPSDRDEVTRWTRDAMGDGYSDDEVERVVHEICLTSYEMGLHLDEDWAWLDALSEMEWLSFVQEALREGERPDAWTLSDDSFDCDDTDGWRYGLYIDPESRHVSHWAHHGNGTPMPVWHSRAVIIPLPRGAVGSEVRDLLATDGVRTLIEALIGTYQGSRWDGSNHIGQWRDDTTSLACELTELFEDVATYMRAADYWANTWTQATADDIRRDMAQLGRDVRGIARMIVADVSSQGEYVDESDMVASIEEMLEEFPVDQEESI